MAVCETVNEDSTQTVACLFASRQKLQEMAGTCCKNPRKGMEIRQTPHGKAMMERR